MGKRAVSVTKVSRPNDGRQTLEKVSYRVSISRDDTNVVIEARLSLRSLETLSQPEELIRDWFMEAPLPKPNEVIDLGPKEVIRRSHHGQEKVLASELRVGDRFIDETRKMEVEVAEVLPNGKLNCRLPNNSLPLVDIALFRWPQKEN